MKYKDFKQILSKGEMTKIIGGKAIGGGDGCAKEGEACDAASNTNGVHCCTGLSCDSGEGAKCIKGSI